MKRIGKRIGRWLARIVAGAISTVLVIVLLPWGAKLAWRYLPDITGHTEVVAQTLARHFEESARLETMKIKEDGVLTSSTSALFLGTVQQVTIRYRYEMSLGIDLREVSVSAQGHTLTITLPRLEVLSDSLTPEEVTRDDFWYPLTEKRRKALLEAERITCRTRCLEEQSTSADTWEQTCRMFDETIAGWLVDTSGLAIVYEQAAEASE